MLGIEAPVEGIQPPETTSVVKSLGSSTNTVIMTTVLLAYPLFIMPVYRSSFISDDIRLLIVCLVHPILTEFVSSYQRFGKGFLYCASD